jgi:hypothetical protein
MFRKLYIRWKYRDYSHSDLADAYSMLLKFARRCAYDLDHSISFMRDGHWAQKEFEHRSRHWLKIFSPSGMKNYRQQIFEHIDAIERDNEELRAELRAAGIEPKTGKPIPF